MNYIEDDLDKKAFGITYLKSVVDNLNITDLQHKNTKVEATVKTLNRQMQQKFYFWGVLGNYVWELNITWCLSGYTLIEYNINGLETIIDIMRNEVFRFGF